MTTREQGLQGEEQAANYLTKKGHRIIARNFRAPGGEIDIITRVQNTLVFVEVKQRAYEAFGGPLGAVTPAKQKRIARTAAAFIKSHRDVPYDEIRFDIIGILPGKLDHIEGAFFPPRTTL